MRKENISKYNPDNFFPNYTGDTYRWGIDSREKDKIVLNETNEKGEYIVVSCVGKFVSGKHQSGPSYKFPSGKYNIIISKDIFFLTKIKENREIENHLLFSNYSEELFENNLDLVKELFSDDNIKFAEENNNGYIGDIVKYDNEENARLIYNDININEFVTALEFAQKYNSTNILEKNKNTVGFKKVKNGSKFENAYEIYKNEMFDYHSELAAIFYSNNKIVDETKKSIQNIKFNKKNNDNEIQIGD